MLFSSLHIPWIIVHDVKFLIRVQIAACLKLQMINIYISYSLEIYSSIILHSWAFFLCVRLKTVEILFTIFQHVYKAMLHVFTLKSLIKLLILFSFLFAIITISKLCLIVFKSGWEEEEISHGVWKVINLSIYLLLSFQWIISSIFHSKISLEFLIIYINMKT